MRMKNNADLQVTKVLLAKTKQKQAKGGIKQRYIMVAMKKAG